MTLEEKATCEANILNKLNFTGVNQAFFKYISKSFIMSISSSNNDYNNNLQVVSQPEVVQELKFDFKSTCLFCGRVVDFKNVKKSDRREIRNPAMKDKIILFCERNSNELTKPVEERVRFVHDLTKEGAIYHRQCELIFFKDIDKPTGPVGRPVNKDMQTGFEKLFDYLDNNFYEFGFSWNLLRGECFPTVDVSITYMKRKLVERYGKDVTISTKYGDTIIFRKNELSKILEGVVNSKNKQSRNQVMKAAAEILKQEISEVSYSKEFYPSVKDIETGGKDLIPEDVIYFLEKLIGDEKKNIQKIITFGNCLVSTVEPKFMSPVQYGLSITLHRHFSSRYLIDILNNLGFGISYSEVLLFENSVVFKPSPKISLAAFVQFIFDNADFNIRTLDGKNTFHAMGGVMAISPKDAFTADCKIKRCTKLAPSAEIEKFGTIPLKPYDKSSTIGALKNVYVKYIAIDEMKPTNMANINASNFLWMCGPIFDFKYAPSYSGYMDKATANINAYVQSEVLPLPFINSNPSDFTTIHTSLKFAVSQCKEHNQKTCFVTYDQPLHYKAVKIVKSADSSSDLSKVVIVCGGFHLLMSFLGAIGYIMHSSGLSELWEQIYAKNSVNHMMGGHAYSRALRAHFLTQLALSKVIFNKLNQDDVDIDELELIHSKSFEDIDYFTNPTVSHLLEKHDNFLLNKSATSETAKLWMQYWHMIDIVRNFLRAERTGNRELHLYIVGKMIPFLYAAGRSHYAKSAQLHLQEMMALSEEVMGKDEFQKYAKEGYFTIRRQDKFWCGSWPDMVIEQNLMRTMKISGGLTNGRGFAGSTLIKWISAIPYCTVIQDSLEKFANVRSSSSEQHVELRCSRQNRDRSDLGKLVDWLELHNPFNENCSSLISISSGVVASAETNCHNAEAVGKTLLMAKLGTNFEDLKVERSAKVKTIGHSSNAITVGSESIPINPHQLLYRALTIANQNGKLKECFSFELSSTCPSLFKDNIMRKTVESTIFTYFDKLSPPVSSTDRGTSKYIIDGGYLLDKVVWTPSSTFGEILHQYVKYIEFHYGDKAVVVFDGYANKLLPKSVDETSQKQISTKIMFQHITKASIKQADFFSNIANKRKFIYELSLLLWKANITVVQARINLHVSIMQSAIEEANTSKEKVFVVGDDFEILVLLIHNCSSKNLYMLRAEKLGQGGKVTNIYELQIALGPLKPHILFLQSATGGRTTSAMFGKGKVAVFKKIQKKTDLLKKLSIFLDKEADLKQIFDVGQEFLFAVYNINAKNCDNLNAARYYMYNTQIAQRKLDKDFNISNLPPTNSSAEQHLMRIFWQVQTWIGNNLDPMAFGWKERNESIFPIITTDAIAPNFVINAIFCNCKSECGLRCTCRINSMHCSDSCGVCFGVSCSNKYQDEPKMENDDGELFGEPTMVNDDEE